VETAVLVQGELVLAEAERLCAQAVRICDASGQAVRIAELVQARAVRGIRGGSGGDRPTNAQVRTRIRQLLDGGVLPREDPGRVVAGVSAGGRRCAACHEDLALGELEYELTTAAVVVLLFHRRCLQLYASEVLDGTS
jgi:hypothetical protein